MRVKELQEQYLLVLVQRRALYTHGVALNVSFMVHACVDIVACDSLIIL